MDLALRAAECMVKVHGLGRGLTSGGERHLWTHSTDTGQEVNGSDDRFHVGGVEGG